MREALVVIVIVGVVGLVLFVFHSVTTHGPATIKNRVLSVSQVHAVVHLLRFAINCYRSHKWVPLSSTQPSHHMYHIFLSPRLDHSTSFFLPFSTSAAAAAISRRPLSSLPVRGRRQLRQVREISPLLPFPNRVSLRRWI